MTPGSTSFICRRCKDAMCADCRSMAEEYETLLMNWKRATSASETRVKGLERELATVKPRAEALYAERDQVFRMIRSAFETMRGGQAYKEIVLHTLDAIKPYVVGENAADPPLLTARPATFPRTSY